MENNNQTKWINTILLHLNALEDPQSIKVLESCGRECLNSSGTLEKIRNLRNEIDDKNDMDLLFKTYKEKIYQNRPTLYKVEQDIYLEYHECGCGMVKEGGVTNPFLCNCTVGYTKQIFETLFDRPVEVHLFQSILKGDDICKQRIVIKDV